MKKWQGASAICINKFGELLMVLQGKPEEEKLWASPSGGKELGETFEECCIREVFEETGYIVEIVEKLQVKQNDFVEVHYFLVEIIGGELKIQDPDQLIYDISWKSVDEIKTLPLSFPEDRYYLMECMVNYENLTRG
ncbi:NUDIX hydrolase [Ureibacillus acetophenoni]|uniref:ADP-ribose pyrophosphatase YjhB (NUDIX family) n=1 Tax=Ureibacillus acetophenoni TaxID=614649 RepID=A0A285ULF4_9BACL|nr:NUDIX hydrolase [Ureibacillus acetophenoni]SOC42744.1 ADP-ribose pyrophosphatase YjhB (NUDIX family) [Ureibacillus acetophenoni]